MHFKIVTFIICGLYCNIKITKKITNYKMGQHYVHYVHWELSTVIQAFSLKYKKEDATDEGKADVMILQLQPSWTTALPQHG